MCYSGLDNKKNCWCPSKICPPPKKICTSRNIFPRKFLRKHVFLFGNLASLLRTQYAQKPRWHFRNQVSEACWAYLAVKIQLIVWYISRKHIKITFASLTLLRALNRGSGTAGNLNRKYWRFERRSFARFIGDFWVTWLFFYLKISSSFYITLHFTSTKGLRSKSILLGFGSSLTPWTHQNLNEQELPFQVDKPAHASANHSSNEFDPIRSEIIEMIRRRSSQFPVEVLFPCNFFF